MVREDIIEGLRAAMTRGQTLRQAMMSFYNAGYIKEEIEEAARALQQRMSNPVQPQFAPAEEAPVFQRGQSMKTDTKEKPKEVLSQTAQLAKSPTSQPVQTIQRVSAYGEQKKLSPQQQPQQIPQPPQPPQPVQQPLPPPQQKPQPVQQLPPPQIKQIPPQAIPRVSAYGVQQPYYPQGRASKPSGKTAIFLLLALLIILIGLLVAVLFFKEEILAFFDSF